MARDYTAERKARNAAAQRLGFSSLDALHRARKAGEFPSAKAMRTDAAAKRRATRITNKRVAQGLNIPKDQRKIERAATVPIAELDKESRLWSASHSKQVGTEFNPRWSQSRRVMFHRAFVAQFRIPNDERDFTDTYAYMRAFPEDFDDVPDRDDDPYSNESG